MGAFMLLAVQKLITPMMIQTLEHLDLTEVLKAGQTRCGLITHPDELVGSVSAYGQVNRSYKCYNNKIRFVVQDGSRPIGTLAWVAASSILIW